MTAFLIFQAASGTLQRFQAALWVELRQFGADLRGGIVYIAACDDVGVVVKALDDGQLAQIIVYVLRGEEVSVQIPADIQGASLHGGNAVVQMPV